MTRPWTPLLAVAVLWLGIVPQAEAFLSPHDQVDDPLFRLQKTLEFYVQTPMMLGCQTARVFPLRWSETPSSGEQSTPGVTWEAQGCGKLWDCYFDVGLASPRCTVRCLYLPFPGEGVARGGRCDDTPTRDRLFH